jgi:hypothetical protein
MANQMIALQARNPQLPDPARATTQMANMMNMASQQRAAQLQGERIRQEMEYARAGESRAEETQRLNVRKEDQAYRVAGMKELRNRGLGVLQSGSEEAYQLWLRQADAIDPDSAAVMRQIAPTFNKDAMTFAITEADKFIENNTQKRKSEIIYDKNGVPILVESGGNTEYEATPIVATKIRDVNQPPRATPTAPTASAMERGPSAASDAAMTFGPDATRPLNEYQQEDLRNLESQLGMQDTPASFTRGDMGAPAAAQMTPERAQQIVDSAVRSRVMAQEDFDQLMAMAPEQNKQPFMDMIQANNITLQPSGMGQQSQFAVNQGQRPQAEFAVNRGAPPPATLAQYRVGDPIQGRNPSVGAYPGSAQVPLTRVAGEAEARRETPAQIKVRKAAELQAAEEFEEANKTTRLARERQKVFEGERAKKDAAFLDSYNDATTKGRTTLNVINQMIGDAKVEKGSLVVPKGGRRPHPGFEGVVGMGIPGVRFIPGTQAASFDALFRQAEGGAFLQAYESLRGTGQITEIEGSKATSALTRMERSQTEVEFVKAAREFADVIRGAIARADKRYTALTGEAPAAAPARRKTPTKGSDGWGKAKVVGN